MKRLVIVAALAAGCGPVELRVDEGSPDPPKADVVKPILVIPTRRFPSPSPSPPPPSPSPPAPVPADCTQVRVVNTGGETLHVRPDPSTTNAPVGELSSGQTVSTLAIVDGESINGDTTWYQIDAGGGLTGFISGAYADCVDPNAPPPVAGFMLPLACGTTTTITQGNNGAYSHQGYAYYAFDFGIPRHTPLMAIEDGTVIATSDVVQPGDACWAGGGQECANTVNYVLLQHSDGTASLYMHLDTPTVNVGDAVSRGQQVGFSGGTGWSTGPHAHLQRQGLCGSWWCQSVQTQFADFNSGGIPQTGDTVTSGNCP
jgi:hypothetical protein